MLRRLFAWFRRAVHLIGRLLAASDDPDRAPLFSRPTYVPTAWAGAR
jgi:hypothetical protein